MLHLSLHTDSIDETYSHVDHLIVYKHFICMPPERATKKLPNCTKLVFQFEGGSNIFFLHEEECRHIHLVATSRLVGIFSDPASQCIERNDVSWRAMQDKENLTQKHVRIFMR